MQENQKKAFDFAADLTKQLITLSTAIITLTVTFSKDIIGKVDNPNRYILLLSWVMFLFSILMGVLTLMALTGNLDPLGKKQKDANGKNVKNEDGSIKRTPVLPQLTITSSNVRGTGQWQVWTFLFAVGFTCWYGYEAATTEDTVNHSNDYRIVRKTQLGTDSTLYIDTLYVSKTQHR